MVSMGIEIRYRGKVYGEQDVDDIRELINRNPGQSRYFLSKELCRFWNWTQVNGTPKDMVCRGLMLLLDREGLIKLPGKKRELPWLSLKRSAPLSRAVDMTDIAGPLSLLSPLDLAMVRRTPAERLYQSLIIRSYGLRPWSIPRGDLQEPVIRLPAGANVLNNTWSSLQPCNRCR